MVLRLYISAFISFSHSDVEQCCDFTIQFKALLLWLLSPPASKPFTAASVGAASVDLTNLFHITGSD